VVSVELLFERGLMYAVKGRLASFCSRLEPKGNLSAFSGNVGTYIYCCVHFGIGLVDKLGINLLVEVKEAFV
jgi:hypothetical protein